MCGGKGGSEKENTGTGTANVVCTFSYKASKDTVRSGNSQ